MGDCANSFYPMGSWILCLPRRQFDPCSAGHCHCRSYRPAFKRQKIVPAGLVLENKLLACFLGWRAIPGQKQFAWRFKK